MRKILLISWLLSVVFKLNGQSGFVKANGIRLEYESIGKSADPPVILIQGTGAPITQ